MYCKLKISILSILSSFVLSFLIKTVSAGPIDIEPSTFGISLVTIVVLVISVIAIAVIAGGVKYVTPENVLDTDVRKNLYEYIDNYPGSHLREISRELNLKPSNAAWHLRKLEQTNLIRSRTIGGKKVYYLVEGGIEARREAVAECVLRNKNARQIMEYLKKNPGKHLLEIAHALNMNHHTVKWHIKKMYMAELIDGDTSHSVYPVYYPTDIGVQSLKNFSESIKKPGRAS